MKHLFAAAAIAAALIVAGPAAAATVFSDNFNDNDLSDWTLSTNYGGSAGLESGVNDSLPGTMAEGVLGAYIDAPPGGVDLFARATRSLNLLAGDYTLTLDALSVPCGGCTISYDVLFNGVSLARTATNGGWSTGVTFNLGSLAAGPHTLTLGMHTTNASSGHFLAQFDNVELDGQNLVSGAVPEPSTWAMMIAGFLGAGSMLRRKQLLRA